MTTHALGASVETGDPALDQWDDTSRSGLVSDVYKVLDEIYDPCSVATSVPMGLVEMGIIESVEVSDTGRVLVSFRLTSPFCEMIAYMKGETIRRVGELSGVAEVSVQHDKGLDWDHDMIAPAAQARRRLRLLTIQQLAQDRSLLKQS